VVKGARQLEEGTFEPELLRLRVENVRQGDSFAFSLKILGGDRLRQLLERAKERRYYEVPWPVADYDPPRTRDSRCP
jgi:hypothetical protein